MVKHGCTIQQNLWRRKDSGAFQRGPVPQAVFEVLKNRRLHLWGGYAMIPLIRREIALREGWIEDKDILDILAVSESTPGPIAVNTATFVGYRVAGPLGAACATVGVVLPALSSSSLELCPAPV